MVENRPRFFVSREAYLAAGITFTPSETDAPAPALDGGNAVEAA